MKHERDFRRYSKPVYDSHADLEAASRFDRAVFYTQQFEVCTGLVIPAIRQQFKAGEKSITIQSSLTLMPNGIMNGSDQTYQESLGDLISATGLAFYTQTISSIDEVYTDQIQLRRSWAIDLK